MGSITNSLSSLSSLDTSTGSSSSSSPNSSNPTGIFTGTSAYSQDFQNVINRAVAIASLPIDLLTNQQNTLTNQSNELATINTLFANLQAAIQGIDSALGGSSFQTAYTTDNIVSTTLGNGATEGVYTIKVDNIGSYATSLSASTWPASSSGTPQSYNLVVGSNTYTLAPADNSVGTIVSTINAEYGSVVHATAVNVGSSSSPDYRISLQSATLGPMNLDLETAPTGTAASLQSQGPFAVSQSTSTWDTSADPSQYSLVVNGTPYAFTATSSSAPDVADAINSQLGSTANVAATVVDLGTNGNHDYRLSLQSLTPGSEALDIRNPTVNDGLGLQTQQTASTSLSTADWDSTPDSSGNHSVYNLVIGSSTYTFAPAENTAATVAATINAEFGSQVQASVVNVGTSASPAYRIALQDKTGTNPTLDLQKTNAVGYQNQQTTGTLAQYEIDGSGVAVTSKTRDVTVTTGVTLTLEGTGTTDVTVTRSTSALSTVLSSFADAYNALVDELGKQQGQSAGPLQGQSIVSLLSQTLRSISTYGNTSSQITGLASLGLTFDQSNNGHLDFDATTLMLADFSNSVGVTSFLGSATSGGFLQAATDALNTIEDPVTGLLKTAESNLQTQITNIGNQISTKQNQVSQLQTNLTNQMAAMDAMIASMEQQYAQLSAMFQAQQTADQQYANGL